MKSFAALALASILASAVSAQKLAYSYPIGATVWDVSKPASLYVQWTNDCKNLTDGTVFDVNLNTQRADGVQIPAPGVDGPIGSLDCKSKGKVSVTLPDTIPSGDKYSVYVKNGAEDSWSALFTITNPKVPAVTTSGAVTSATATATATVTATTSGTVNRTTTTAATKTATSSPTQSPNAAGALKIGSTAALVIVAAVGLML
ncbi:hypothetical protein EDD11_008406 [Mortierella claussenii]|nr:hypothetical protein EDD11_008406 [Mortierella claussenii]